MTDKLSMMTRQQYIDQAWSEESIAGCLICMALQVVTEHTISGPGYVYTISDENRALSTNQRQTQASLKVLTGSGYETIHETLPKTKLPIKARCLSIPIQSSRSAGVKVSWN